MEWISVKDRLPPKTPIMVLGDCGMPHVAQYDYDIHCHTENCDENGGHGTGEEILFSYWMPLPNPPITKDPA